jgi:putative phosphoesterase
VRIGLVSDTHGSTKSFEKVMSGPFRDVDLILHAGDVLHRGAGSALLERLETNSLAERINSLSIPVLIAKGNCDSEADQGVLKVPIMSPYVFLYVEGRKIMVVHGNGKREEDLEDMMTRFGLALLVHGHSHIARIKKTGAGLIVNPGTPTIPNPSSPYGKTVGVFDLESGIVEVCNVETGEAVLEGSVGA